MAKFIEKYIEPPIKTMIATEIDLVGDITISVTVDSIRLCNPYSGF